MKNLIPLFIQEQYQKNQYEGESFSLTMFVDISGFTQMTESLMRIGEEGAETLSSILNKIFNPILNAIYKRGGFVSTFAGDGFTVIFPQKNPASQDFIEYRKFYTLFSARKIQDIFRQHGTQKTKFGDFELEVKIGLSCGNVEWGIVGKDEKMYFFRGEGIDGCVQAEHRAKRGEIIFDEKLYQLINSDEVVFETHEKGYYCLKNTSFDHHPLERRKRIPSTTTKDLRKKTSQLSKKVAAKFLPNSVIEFNQAGEFRKAVALFISFSGISSKVELDQFASILIKNSRRFSGYFNKIDFGDKGPVALFVFGAPIAFENNIERSLDFIFAVINDIKNIPNLRIRVGITYGTVYAGIIGGQKRSEYTIIGDTVNLSARLMMRADVGDIWVPEAIQQFAKEKYEFASVGIRQFKGKSESIHIFKLIKPKEIHQRLFEGGMIGRQHELKLLHQYVKPLFQQQFTGITYVYGEPGMGKSRLAYEFKWQLMKEHEFNWYECLSDQILQRPFNPFIYLLKNYFYQSSEKSIQENREQFENEFDKLLTTLRNAQQQNQQNAKRLQEIEKELIRTKSILAALIGLYWRESLYEQLDAKGRYENTQAALKNFILGQSLLKPTIIELEDGHWLDKDSRQFLNILTRNIDDYPLMLLTTLRYEDDGSKPKFPLENVSENEIDLQFLTDDDVRLLAETQLNGKIDDDLYYLLLDRTHANPFYVQQYLYYFTENKLLRLDQDIWRLKTTDIQLPDTINAILMARIDRLSQQVKEVVKAAAVIGKEFELRILSRVMKGDVSHEVSAAEKEQIWTALSELHFIFKHGLLRDSAYKMQLQSRRRELHQLTAKAIETLYAENLATKYTELALHYERAEIISKAMKYLQKAGDQAKSSYENEQALNFYDRFLKYLSISDVTREERLDQQIDVLLKKGIILRLVGRWSEAENTFRAAASLSKKLDDKIKMARASGDWGWLLYWRGDYDRATKCFTEQLAYSQEAESDEEISRAYGNMGAICRTQGDYEKAMEYYHQLLELSKNINSKNGISRAYGEMGIVYLYTGDHQAAMECYEKQLPLNEELEDKPGISRTFGNIGTVLWMMGDYDQAMSYFEKNLQLSEELGDKNGISFSVGNMGAILAQNGKYDQAMDNFERKLKLTQEMGDKSEIAMAIFNIGNVFQDTGKYDQASEHFEKALALFEELDNKWGLSMALTRMGVNYREGDEFDQAMTYFDKAIVIVKDVGIKYNLADALLEKAELSFVLKRYNTALEVTREAVQIAEEVGLDEFRFRGHVLMAKIDFAFDEKEKAIQKLEQMLSETNETFEKATIHYELWKMTQDREHHQRALSLFQELYKVIPKFDHQKRIIELSQNE